MGIGIDSNGNVSGKFGVAFDSDTDTDTDANTGSDHSGYPV